MRQHNLLKGLIIIAFGSGLFLAYCFPGKFLVIALALILIIAGFVMIRC